MCSDWNCVHCCFAGLQWLALHEPTQHAYGGIALRCIFGIYCHCVDGCLLPISTKVEILYFWIQLTAFSFFYLSDFLGLMCLVKLMTEFKRMAFVKFWQVMMSPPPTVWAPLSMLKVTLTSCHACLCQLWFENHSRVMLCAFVPTLICVTIKYDKIWHLKIIKFQTDEIGQKRSWYKSESFVIDDGGRISHPNPNLPIFI